ncbi:MAG: HMA2 domain-containing protein [Candidatus Binatia bacterium]
MATPVPRIIELAHASPGRLRLRCPWLRHDRGACTALADRIAKVRGVREVEVRPRTGSVLCQYDPARTNAEQLVAAVRRDTGVATLAKAGETNAPLPARPRGPSAWAAR